MESIPTLRFAGITRKLTETRDAPHLGRDLPIAFEQVSGNDDLTQERTKTEQPDLCISDATPAGRISRASRARAGKPIHTPDNRLSDARVDRQRGLRVTLVHYRDVVELIRALLQ